jgi:purine-binding chemotaxis protein CheW
VIEMGNNELAVENSEMAENKSQFVVFLIGKEYYGINIHSVNSIERVLQITRVPGTPGFVKGVINLRGDIIPIIDLRQKFNLEESEITDESRVIILKEGDLVIGIISDMVLEVLELENENIDSMINCSSENMVKYIWGISKIDDKVVTLLKIDNILSLEDE